MRDFFIWNDTDCRDYGIHVSEQPPITFPSERSTQTVVPGRPGSLTTLEGDDIYDDLLLTCECFITDNSRILEIGKWLKGGGKVVFGSRPGGHYKARIANQIAFEKVLRGHPHRTFSVNFRCEPFWYPNESEDITLTASGNIIHNPGSVFSEPIITVYGSGDIAIMVGTALIELKGIEESVNIDSVLKEAYQGMTEMNDHMNGDFPVLKPGMNPISWTGPVTKVVVTPNWRYL